MTFDIAPRLSGVFGSVTPPWNKLDVLEHTEDSIDRIVERELSFFVTGRPARRRPSPKRGRRGGRVLRARDFLPPAL
jgi:hypothetical protein